MPSLTLTAKYGLLLPELRSDLDPHMIRSTCCRLQLDCCAKLLKRGNGLFGSAELTGSIGVVTLNMARLGYLYKEGREASHRSTWTNSSTWPQSPSKSSAETIQRHMDPPYSRRYLGTLDNHFSTIGVNGMNCRWCVTSDDATTLTDPRGFDMCVPDPGSRAQRMDDPSEGHRPTYNLGRPPRVRRLRFAKEDRKRFADSLQAGTPDQPYYTNSSQLPVAFTDSPFQALGDQRVRASTRKLAFGPAPVHG